MGSVNATIAGRQFRLACEDGHEAHLQALAADIDARIVELRNRFGEIGDTRLTVMAALMVADENTEIQRKLRRLEEEVTAEQRSPPTVATRGGLEQIAQPGDVQPRLAHPSHWFATDHRRCREHRAGHMPEERIEDAGRDRDRENVVDEGEEEILADVPHRSPRERDRPRHRGEPAGEERQVGGLHRDIGP